MGKKTTRSSWNTSCDRRSSLNNWPQRTDMNITIRHRAMVSLQHDRIGGRFGNCHVGAGAAVDFHVLLYLEPIMQHTDEARVGRLLPAGVKTRSTEPDLERLPLARPPAGGPRWRG